MDLLKGLENVIQPVIESEGFVLDSVEFTVEQGEKFVRIFLAKPGVIITLEDIVMMTRLLSPLIDASGVIPYAYILDITSAPIKAA